MRNVVIASIARTAVGAFQGALTGKTAPQLGAIAIAEAVKRAGIDKEKIDEVIMGNVLAGGVGQAPARQAAIFAGLPTKVECLTINKVCGSGLKAVMLAADAIANGHAEIIVAGGQESMTNAPYAIPGARAGLRMNNATIVDTMVNDGLWDPYNNFHMGVAAELCAAEYKISRERQDAFGILSNERAIAATKEGRFKAEIVPVPIPQKKGEPILFAEDENMKKFNRDKVSGLKPAFKKDGTVTAANASSINDGGAAAVVMAEDAAKAHGIKPLARIIKYCAAAHPPEWFTTAPVTAMAKCLKLAGMTPKDIDLWEINEAFAVVSIYAIDQLKLSTDTVNVNGGAIAIGHPIGASGARILATLLHALKARGKTRGMASLCIGGGEGVAFIVEMLN